jgi:hypothetical protein
MEFDNIETIKRAIEIDAGVALLPEPTVLREVEAKSLVMVPLATDELVRPLGIIHRRGKELGSTTRRFIELLQNHGQSTADAPHRLVDACCADSRDSNGNGHVNGHSATHVSAGGSTGSNGSHSERPEPVAVQ